MECKSLFSEKNIINLLSAKSAQRVVKVMENYEKFLPRYSSLSMDPTCIFLTNCVGD